MTVNKRPITAEDLKKINIVKEPQIAADGEKYVFVQTIVGDDLEYYSHLFVHNLADDLPVQWTFGKVRDHSPRWSPDGSELAFVSNRSGGNQLWMMSTAGGEPRQITELKNGAAEPIWSPDGRFLLFSTPLAANEMLSSESDEEHNNNEQNKPVKVEKLKYKSDEKGIHKEKRTQLVLYDIKKEHMEVLTDGDFDHHSADWSPDSRQIVFSANRDEDEDRSNTLDLFIIDTETKDIVKLTNSTGVFSMAKWSKNGKKIACFGHELEYKGATLNQVWIIDPLSKERTCMTLKWDVQIGDATVGDIRSSNSNPGPMWSSDERHIFFTASDHGNTGLYQMDMQGEITSIHEEENHLFGCSYHADLDLFVAGISDPSNPGDLFKITRKEKGKVRLTDVNASFLKEVHLSIPEPIVAKAEDGWEIHGWIMRPANFEEGQRYPMILEIHGGPHAMYANTFFHEFQLLAANGYVVLYTNPRGSHGYGQTFVNACRHDYGGKDYHDLISAVDHVLEHYDFIDEDRLGVTGGSYGGFMTNWIIGHTNRFKAAVTQRSISNWTSFYGVSDIGYFFTEWELGAHVFDDPEKLWHHSPIKYAQDINTPLLIMHGEKDYRCPIEQGEQLFTTLKYLQKPVAFLWFPEANHELSRSGPPSLRLERLNHMVEWFQEHLHS
ncbi:S9 family peptidase [Alteribacillus sp. YIM 98480]|uniref:S9 family peptidase n=1 Tax=Alteribacillus sp. YIM 98480 TaxID=2606599 RepID=UPI00131DEFF0|nr:S9 family peptidase [Alteribacillus sp. YIM 98480]